MQHLTRAGQGRCCHELAQDYDCNHAVTRVRWLYKMRDGKSDYNSGMLGGACVGLAALAATRFSTFCRCVLLRKCFSKFCKVSPGPREYSLP